MTDVRIRFRQDAFALLDQALTEPEEVVFLYATFVADTFHVDAIEVMSGADIASQSPLHVELADEIRPRVVKTAWDTGRCLLEAHSHGDRGFAEFSWSDLRGFDEWVPHVRWRLRERPYAALVKADDAWDALAWIDGDKPVGVDAIEITDDRDQVVTTIKPTDATRGPTR